MSSGACMQPAQLALKHESSNAAIMPPEWPHQEHVNDKSICHHKQPYGDACLYSGWWLHVQQYHKKGHGEVPANVSARLSAGLTGFHFKEGSAQMREHTRMRMPLGPLQDC